MVQEKPGRQVIFLVMITSSLLIYILFLKAIEKSGYNSDERDYLTGMPEIAGTGDCAPGDLVLSYALKWFFPLI